MASSGETTRRRSSRRRARNRRLALAWLIAAVGAGTGVLADAAPTGISAADGTYRGLYVLLVALACAFSRRWTWPLLAGGALLGGPTGAWLWVGVLALALAVASQFDRRRRQPVGAVIGVLAALTLLRLPPTLAFGVPSLIAAVAPLPAALSALANVRSKVSRPAVVAIGALAGLGLLLALVFGVGVLLIRSDANDGVASARAGLDALRAGDEVTATEAFASAADSFRDANDTATAWWMAPAELVPVLSQHLDVARVLTEEGIELAETSERTAPAVSLGDLTTASGRFRLDRIDELEPLATDVVAALHAGQASLEELSTDWLTGPMVDAVESLEEEIAGSLPDAETAVEALALAPGLLGADGPRNYLVLFGNPAEAREMGGFVASMGLLTADDGVVDFISLDDPGELEQRLRDADARLTVDVPASMVSAQPARFVRTWTDSPDIATVTAVAADLFPAASGGTEVDGVLYVDPYALAALLELTGPVSIPETGEQLTSENTVDFMLRDQYLSEEFEAGGERKERLGDAGEIAFDRLLSGGLPRPRHLADVLSPLVRAHRLLFATTDPATHDLLERVGLRPAIDEGDDETLLVAHGNRRANKLDAYLERSIDYDAEVAENGTVTATVQVELTNSAPRRGLVPYQTGVPHPDDPGPEPTNHLTLDVYSAFDETEVLVDGEPSPYNDLPAYGLNQYSIPVSVAPGSTAVVEIRLTGTVDPAACRFSFVPNAGSSEDAFRATMVTPEASQTIESRVLDERITSICESG